MRDHSFAANPPGGQDLYFQREQYGGNVGGAFIKNKLFFFADGERTQQGSFAPVQLNGTPFASTEVPVIPNLSGKTTFWER